MTRKTYTFNIQVQITLDDQSDPIFYHLPEHLSESTKKRLVNLISNEIRNSDIIYEDEMADAVEVPVCGLSFCLE